MNKQFKFIKKYKSFYLLIYFFLIFPNYSDANSVRVPLHKPPIIKYNYIASKNHYGVLSAEDIKRYQNIFHFQKSGNWDLAKKYIYQLDNDILMGHVLYQKYMHPTLYRSSYIELSNWLKEYRDLPGANRIYKLAKKRRPNGYKRPVTPKMANFNNQTKKVKVIQNKNSSTKKYTAIKKNNRESKKLYLKIKSQINQEILTNSEKQLLKISQNKLTKLQRNELFFLISTKWYFRGDNDKKAFELASKAANNSRENIVYADWIAGLSAWRLGKYSEAKYHFVKLANSSADSKWNVSAAAFWASRASLKNNDPESFIFWLQEGAKNPRTFYGIISKTLLGEELAVSNIKPNFSKNDYAILKKFKFIQRIIALNEVGELFLADKEAFNLSYSANTEQSNALLKLANKLNLPNTAIKIATKNLDYNDTFFDTSAFPIPDWKNQDDFILDKALIFAFVRQESRFNTNAKSHAGARGLMQLMPRTASFVAKDRSLRGHKKHRLYDPELNLNLGQQYLKILMQNEKLKNNLFLFAAAYNAGPSNINKWLANTRFNNDPFLFIESIPARETRIFIERVLANLWIYRMRFNQDKPSLLNIVEGKWPRYISLDKNL